MNELLRRRVEKLAAGMSPDEKRRVAGWGLRLLAAMSPQEAVEDIERSLDLFSDEDRAQAREALLAVRADYIVWQERTVAPLHRGVTTGHHPVTPHADGASQNENDAPGPTRANPISARYPTTTGQAWEALTRSQVLIGVARTRLAAAQLAVARAANATRKELNASGE
jgi:hypothetical protein